VVDWWDGAAGLGFRRGWWWWWTVRDWWEGDWTDGDCRDKESVALV
jgi:hypothetical protein